MTAEIDNKSVLIRDVITRLFIVAADSKKIFGFPWDVSVTDMDSLENMILSSYKENEGIDAPLSLGYKIITQKPFSEGSEFLGAIFMLHESQKRNFGLEKHQEVFKNVVLTCAREDTSEKLVLKKIHEITGHGQGQDITLD